ncbi:MULTISPECIES: 2Fe-2S iron-sulfur cluster-binding protein [Pandoraea]|uniref:(2Fe-2S)-binding protein n=1 Tax=Pandoraea cepalis TaxID=2508294 RepID=A0AAW7MH26_9BURK|nr:MULTISPECIES: 2Fe-2S iron-sulfur cluster-binding protein [Pandoraea]ALS65180.1 (2Fe-2S)-binding protein [Pandoraea apista]MDN4572062.1 (2Fe-2S)-binding protein [Pandoraea cepalis]MDN4576718.1 (2Fe-2S)-binding protein [Pandoraea cepalis]RRW92417.1 (2Fe-2S)-binding protein [Pandoraea apista]CFB65607.1 Ferredoxin-6 [Pandoraea apista]
MPTIYFVEPGGVTHEVPADAGYSLMQAAVKEMVPGIPAECGGSCSCATCHVYVDDAWFARLPPPSEDEKMMLEGTLEPRPTSRLTCQIIVHPEMDGMVVHVPANTW